MYVGSRAAVPRAVRHAFGCRVPGAEGLDWVKMAHCWRAKTGRVRNYHAKMGRDIATKQKKSAQLPF